MIWVLAPDWFQRGGSFFPEDLPFNSCTLGFQYPAGNKMRCQARHSPLFLFRVLRRINYEGHELKFSLTQVNLSNTQCDSL